MNEMESPTVGGVPPTTSGGGGSDDGLAPEAAAAPGDATIHEPASPAAVAPVRPAARARGRWALALLVAVAVVALASAAVLFVSAGASVSRLAGWVPAGSVFYAEARLDLPGGQGERVADLLGRFPGFADRAQLDAKVTEILDRALGDASGGKVTYSSMKPWLGDVAAVAGKPSAAVTSSGAAVAPLLIVATKDPTAARQWLSANVHADGATVETHGGAQLTTGTSDGMAWAYTVVDDVVLAGEKGAVEEAVDTGGSGTFASSEPFRSAAAAMPGDALGFAFADPKGMMTASLASGATSAGPVSRALVDRLPAWTAATVRANADSLQVDAAAPRVAGFEPAPAHVSTLAAHLPPTTIAAAEVRDVGKLVLATIDQLKSDPATADAAGQLEQALQTAGGADATVGWMGDGTVALAQVDGKPTGGLVVETSDQAAASAKILQLRNLLSLAGAAGGVTVTEEPYGAAKITIVDLGDLRSLAGAAGSGAADGLPAGDVRLAFTLQDGLFVLGGDDAFVKAVLDTTGSASLADQERYRTAIDRAGSSNSGQVYLDLVGLLAFAAPQMPADARARFEQDVKPFTDRLQAVAGASTAGDPMRVRFVVTVK